MLKIMEIVGVALCMDCSGRVEILRCGNPCPDCGGYGMIDEQGDELRLKELEVI